MQSWTADKVLARMELSIRQACKILRQHVDLRMHPWCAILKLNHKERPLVAKDLARYSLKVMLDIAARGLTAMIKEGRVDKGNSGLKQLAKEFRLAPDTLIKQLRICQQLENHPWVKIVMMEAHAVEVQNTVLEIAQVGYRFWPVQALCDFVYAEITRAKDRGEHHHLGVAPLLHERLGVNMNAAKRLLSKINKTAFASHPIHEVKTKKGQHASKLKRKSSSNTLQGGQRKRPKESDNMSK